MNTWRGGRRLPSADTSVTKRCRFTSASTMRKIGTYGWSRIRRPQSVPVGRLRVPRLINKHRIRAHGERRFRVVTTDSKHGFPIAPNVHGRTLTLTAPNQACVGELSDIASKEGWLFQAAMIDLFRHRVVGWSMRPDRERNLRIMIPVFP
jgi:putative transposase